MDSTPSAIIPLKPTKISQGAEAIVYLADHPYSSGKCVVKFRPRKEYRYPVLDIQIVKQRTVSESRIMVKLFQNTVQELNKCEKQNNLDKSVKDYVIYNGGVNCPQLYAVDGVNGFIYMEHINKNLSNGESSSLKNWLWLLESKFAALAGEKLTVQNCENLIEKITFEKCPSLDSNVKQTMITVGFELGNMHLFEVVHGDLTSSNIILDSQRTPVLIDFGLSFQTTLIEDKAVDLYVLEKALDSTHPLFAKHYTTWILEGYKMSYQGKSKRENSKKFYVKYDEIMKRLEAVRMRGRKRSMVG